MASGCSLKFCLRCHQQLNVPDDSRKQGWSGTDNKRRPCWISRAQRVRFTPSLSSASVRGNQRSKRMIHQCAWDRMKTFQPAGCSDVGQKQRRAVKMSFTLVYILYFYASRSSFYMHYCRLLWIENIAPVKYLHASMAAISTPQPMQEDFEKYISLSVGSVSRSHLPTLSLGHGDKVHNSNVQHLLFKWTLHYTRMKKAPLTVYGEQEENVYRPLSNHWIPPSRLQVQRRLFS